MKTTIKALKILSSITLIVLLALLSMLLSCEKTSIEPDTAAQQDTLQFRDTRDGDLVPEGNPNDDPELPSYLFCWSGEWAGVYYPLIGQEDVMFFFVQFDGTYAGGDNGDFQMYDANGTLLFNGDVDIYSYIENAGGPEVFRFILDGNPYFDGIRFFEGQLNDFCNRIDGKVYHFNVKEGFYRLMKQ